MLITTFKPLTILELLKRLYPPYRRRQDAMFYAEIERLVKNPNEIVNAK